MIRDTVYFDDAIACRMRKRIVALFTARHLAGVRANPGQGIKCAQASNELQPIVGFSSVLGAV